MCRYPCRYPCRGSGRSAGCQAPRWLQRKKADVRRGNGWRPRGYHCRGHPFPKSVRPVARPVSVWKSAFCAPRFSRPCIRSRIRSGRFGAVRMRCAPFPFQRSAFGRQDAPRNIGGRADEDGSEDIDTLHFENTLRGAGAGAFFGRAGLGSYRYVLIVRSGGGRAGVFRGRWFRFVSSVFDRLAGFLSYRSLRWGPENARAPPSPPLSCLESYRSPSGAPENAPAPAPRKEISKCKESISSEPPSSTSPPDVCFLCEFSLKKN